MTETIKQPQTEHQPPKTPQTPPEGLDPKLGGLLAYLLFGWIGGLIMFFTQKHPEVRFHGAQSVLASIAVFALYMVLGVFSSVMAFGFGAWALFSMLYSLVGLATFAMWVFLCIKGYNLEHFKLPVIGEYAEKWAAS